MKHFKHQKGISLVEIMVALVISLFLLCGIIQVYLANKTSYSFSNALSRIQENGRYSLDIMAQDLRMAGFFGCATFDPTDTSNVVNNLNPAGAGFDDVDFLGGGLLEGTDNDGLNGSDSITLRGAKPGQVNVFPPYNVSTSAAIFVGPGSSLDIGDIVMVSNCRGADIMQVSNLQSAAGNLTTVIHNTGAGPTPGNFNPDNCKGGNAHCLSQTYGADASMFELQAVTYTIAVGASGEPALWRSENGTNLELIDGIEQMQILYGIDTDNDDYPNRYVVSTAVPDMLDVISVRLMLLARSDSDFITEDLQRYTYNGANITSADQRLRQVFSTTIALRNRIGDS